MKKILYVLATGLFMLGIVGMANAAPVDLFPTPVEDSTSLFPSVDDDYLEVSFTSGFSFTFYGTTYNSIFLNTNGGVTFGAGESDYDLAAYNILSPGIAVFWGDMDASKYGGYNRPNQMTYEQFADKFVVEYSQFQDYDNEDWNNTAKLTLFNNGKILINYGEVLSEDILIGVFDGTHTDDRHLPVQSSYNDYASIGTGIILYDYWDDSVKYNGDLNDMTITFNPVPIPATIWLLGSGLIGLAGTRLRRNKI